MSPGDVQEARHRHRGEGQAVSPAWDGKAVFEGTVESVITRRHSKRTAFVVPDGFAPNTFALAMQQGQDFQPGDKVRVTVELCDEGICAA